MTNTTLEFDRLIQIYRQKQESEEIQEFEDSLIVRESSQTVANWFLAKSSVFEKTECLALALRALDQALEVLKEKDGHSLNLQLQRANILI